MRATHVALDGRTGGIRFEFDDPAVQRMLFDDRPRTFGPNMNEGRVPHVTLWVANGAKPVEANNLEWLKLRRERCEAPTVEGTVGVFLQNQKVSVRRGWDLYTYQDDAEEAAYWTGE